MVLGLSSELDGIILAEVVTQHVLSAVYTEYTIVYSTIAGTVQNSSASNR